MQDWISIPTMNVSVVWIYAAPTPGNIFPGPDPGAINLLGPNASLSVGHSWEEISMSWETENCRSNDAETLEKTMQ
jgi:hypothetical protein